MLSQILAPMTEAEFFREYWTRKFVYIPGPADKFTGLFPWETLNRALEEHRFTPKRLRLVKSGKDLDAKAYLTGERIDSPKLNDELANGATLILNSCEEVYPPLRALCVHLQRLFHVDVIVNLYAGWRHDNGFDVHWDDQDTLILQVSGRKRWKVWVPTRLHPFKEDLVDTSPKTKPETPPIWDSVLAPGGLLSMPRGWWHVAYPMDEPCLHLTVTVKNLHGINFLHWLANQMKSSEIARNEFPVIATREERQAWLNTVLRDLTTLCQTDLVDRYLGFVDSKAQARPFMQLPMGPARGGSKIGKETLLQLALPQPLHFERVNGVAKFKAAEVEWEADADLVPALERFNDGLSHSLAELSPGEDFRLRVLVRALAARGIVRPAPPAGTLTN